MLDDLLFSDWLCLLVIDMIYLVEQWGNKFRMLYVEIEKVRKKIPCGVFLLEVLTTLTKCICFQVLVRADFQADDKLM